jgi:predicted transcriptional regulator
MYTAINHTVDKSNKNYIQVFKSVERYLSCTLLNIIRVKKVFLSTCKLQAPGHSSVFSKYGGSSVQEIVCVHYSFSKLGICAIRCRPVICV